MQSVVITGASKGIGRATALRLDRAGYRVFAGVRRREDADALQAEASDNLQPLMLDVTDPHQIAAAVEQVESTAGQAGLTALINNAGIAVAVPLEYIPLDELRHQFEVNVVGQVAVTQAFLPLIRATPGRIINISSIGGEIANRVTGAYHASKFAIEAITDVLRLELKPWKIPVISVQPGVTATPIWDSATQHAVTIFDGLPPTFHERYGQLVKDATEQALSAAKNGTPPDAIAQVVQTALEARRPRPRYRAGRDAHMMAWFIKPLPARLRDRLILAYN
jgi:NAD(P)-dependent dehydrogenase (short-subunit alcohol dehydrogenase family)